jgi:hypothetical protein
VSGIKAGDPVITTGGYAVPDGTAIKIEKPAAAEAEAGDKSDDKKDETPGPHAKSPAQLTE